MFSSLSTGGAPQVNSHDPYGVPGSANAGRFQYTGQIWLAEAGLYYYKARMYSPTLGRFLQTDPIGYEDNVNLYAYVGNDPINLVDPTGLEEEEKQQITGSRIPQDADGAAFHASFLDDVSVTTYSTRARSEADEAGNISDLELTSSINGKVTDQVWIDFSNPTAVAAFFAHVRLRHFGNDVTNGSVFRSQFQNEAAVFDLARFAAQHAPARDSYFVWTYTYTARYTGIVGRLRGSGRETQLVTFVATATGRFDEQGRRVLVPTTLHPGSVRD